MLKKNIKKLSVFMAVVLFIISGCYFINRNKEGMVIKPSANNKKTELKTTKQMKDVNDFEKAYDEMNKEYLRKITFKEAQAEKDRVAKIESDKKAAEEKQKVEQEQKAEKQQQLAKQTQSNNQSKSGRQSKPSNNYAASSNSSNIVRVNKFQIDGSFPQSGVNAVNNQLPAIPSVIINAFNAQGWTLKLKSYLPNNYSGVTDSGDKSISLANHRYLYLGTIYHEFGHFWDFQILGEASASSEWISIYNAEKNNLVTSNGYSSYCKHYFTTNKEEYFAQCFAQYIVSPSILRSTTPRSYEFIRNKMSGK